MRTAPLSLLLLLATAPAVAQTTNGSDKKPFELVRELQVFQDQAVLKSKSARAQQTDFIAKVAAQLTSFDASAWADRRNARAAVIYVLSGGDPRVLSKLLGSGAALGVDDQLVKGALAYGERRDTEATQLLDGVDLESLDRSVGGHVALVRALLVAKSDPRKAIALLDRARIIAPGTIVEEAALRRQAILAAKVGDLDAFEALSSQYFRRFASSIFERSFERQFAKEIVSKSYAADAKRLPKLEKLLRGLSEMQRRETCLAIAEEGIAIADVEIVRFVARIAGMDAKAQPLEAMRMLLFEAAAVIATPDYEQGRMALRLVDKSKLGAREEGLLYAATAVADEISRPPSPAQDTEQAQAQAVTGEQDSAGSSSAISNAQAAIARVDGLLSETSR
jgi:chemotaxis protein MotC